jgi:hypothetical protein
MTREQIKARLLTCVDPECCSFEEVEAIVREAVQEDRKQFAAEASADAERYRWLKSRMVGVNFDWDDEGMTALAFEMPDNLSFCADCDKNIDAAMLAAAPKPDQLPDSTKLMQEAPELTDEECLSSYTSGFMRGPHDGTVAHLQGLRCVIAADRARRGLK